MPKHTRRRTVRKQADRPKLPTKGNWRTSDEEEVERRKGRAREETFGIEPERPDQGVFGRFAVGSQSGMSYSVEIRDLAGRKFSCSCRDFYQNGLGTCKHIEATLLWLNRRGHKRIFAEAEKTGAKKAIINVSADGETLHIESGRTHLPKTFREWFSHSDNRMVGSVSMEEAVEALSRSRSKKIWLSQDIFRLLDLRSAAVDRKRLRREYEEKIRSGEWREDFTLFPLYPYQREGMLHLAFTGRAMLADEMGLGKTVQAIAAAALLQRMGKVERVLIVCPASLKAEWQEQIEKFSVLSHSAVFGTQHKRKAFYSDLEPPFFLITNYEQILRDLGPINKSHRPDLVILDEAQRIKNWTTKTAQSIKRLESEYAFVLTGTPIENRIDELYSLTEFLDPSIFGSLFRFNRDFYKLDESGKPIGYQNLSEMHNRIAPIFLRRRKSAVEDNLPERTDRTLMVDLTPAQKLAHDEHKHQIAILYNNAKKRPLTKEEHDKLMRELAMARMTCDTNFILDSEDRSSSKIPELSVVLEEILEEPDNKVVIFSEWVKMLQQLREDFLEPNGHDFAWHTGQVPQQKRRGEINRFKTSPECRVFLTTECGGTGLNLQAANFVINCDLPWNPARLEQRIARAWRKHQTRPVTVINLVAKDSIEHTMIGKLAQKQALADGVLDRIGDLDEMKTSGGREEFFKRLEAIVGTGAQVPRKKEKPEYVADPYQRFADQTRADLGAAFVSCEEISPDRASGTRLLVVVKRNAELWKEKLRANFDELFGHEKSDPLFPVEFDVIDQDTKTAMDRLIEAGILQPTVRNVRVLGGEEGTIREPEPRELSAEEKAQIEEAEQQGQHQWKLAEVMIVGGFLAEAQPPLLAALLHSAKAAAVEPRWQEPREVADLLHFPFDEHFGLHMVDLIRQVGGGKTERRLEAIPLLHAALKKFLMTE